MSREVFCRDCVHSKSSRYSTTLYCTHPLVVKKAKTDRYTAEHEVTVLCHDERTNRSWFAGCGVRGRRFQSKY